MASSGIPNAKKLLKEYSEGRRDFQGSNLCGYDFFSEELQTTHKAFFEKKLSSLILEKAKIIEKPIAGIELKEAIFDDSDLTFTSFTFSGLINASFRRTDFRFASLAGADLRGADLREADLRYTNLFKADFSGANLRNAKLDGASADWATFDGADMHGVTAIATNFTEASLLYVSLAWANLRSALLLRSRLNHAEVENCSFQLANLLKAVANEIQASSSDFIGAYGANFSSEQSDFSNACFRDSFLNNVLLNGSNFDHADFNAAMILDSFLNKAIFSESNLQGSTLSSCQLEGTKFYGAMLANTSLSNLDLTSLTGSSVKHLGPSFIDHLSVSKTVSQTPIHPLDYDPLPELKKFLVASGIPPVVALYSIDANRTLLPQQMVQLMRSTFISYGSPDEEFAERLNKDLLENGVTTFYFPMDAPFGEKLHSTMRRVDQYDRIILICSRLSLDRNGVQYELEKTIDREARDGGHSYLIPIALDSFIFDEWQPEKSYLRQEILSRVVADFRDPDKYTTQLTRLLRALKNADYELSENRLDE